jgi:glycolate oxidase
MAEIESIARRHDTTVATFGHAGDGNLHPTLVFARGDGAARARAMQAFDGIVAAALRLGGTITGEHGVGRLKRRYLATELGEAGMAAHHAVKNAFDPLGILNPGAVL